MNMLLQYFAITVLTRSSSTFIAQMNEIPRAFCIIPALFKTISELIYHITGDNELISKQFNGQLVLQTKLL